MDIQEFIKKIEPEFDQVKPGTLIPETDFRDIEEWGSMHALIIIALVDTEYGVTLAGDDLRSANTIRDLFDIIQKKLQA